ncbi:hypothetical protein [Xanthomonas campestris]|uniref:hypothetical protein n=1 Tax=Xanthomonas campestris TaxID=339 RepID=UPI00137A52C9|nr:hypothetical protein [Xanthomonas campestris]MEB2187252.1 hypothetical protein [Xanthomonas campestris pv. campestris]WDI95419.1 hypothetical protein JH280_09415 [Xanthomonas campestris]
MQHQGRRHAEPGSARSVLLEAGQLAGSQQSKGSNAGFEVGVGAQTVVYAYVQASVGSHNSNAESTGLGNIQLIGKNVVLNSKSDTTLRHSRCVSDWQERGNV